MMWSFVLNGIVGFIVLVSFLFAIPDVGAVLDPATNPTGMRQSLKTNEVPCILTLNRLRISLRFPAGILQRLHTTYSHDLIGRCRREHRFKLLHIAPGFRLRTGWWLPIQELAS